MWRSNPVWDLKNNQTHFHSLSPHPTRSCKGPCSRALLPQIPHLIAFYRSCPIRCLMFILFPTLSPEPFCQSQSEKCTSFFSALKLHPDPKNRERIVFILCETVLSKKKTPFARVFMRSHETGYLLACCHFSCRPHEDICVHVEALNTLSALWTGCSSERLHCPKTGRQSVPWTR